MPSASRDQLGKLIQLYHQGVGSHGKGPLGNPFGKDSMIISFPHSCKGPQHRYPKPMTIPLPRSLVCFISALVPMFPTTLGGPRYTQTQLDAELPGAAAAAVPYGRGEDLQGAVAGAKPGLV